MLEAMIMDYTAFAPSDVVVTEFYFLVGALVEGGAELLSFAGHDL